jgi:GH15 family glucan-1,4-alpha-glucosidase
VRRIVDFVCFYYDEPDMSIWEVRNKKQNFVYSKIMMWVALDRGLRLADKRSLPCPRRMDWLNTRDRLYEEIMNKGWNQEKGFFCQSYENKECLDASLLIMREFRFLSFVLIPFPIFDTPSTCTSISLIFPSPLSICTHLLPHTSHTC